MRKPQILIIDDNKEFVGDLELLLQQDFDCSGVFSGEQGLQLLEQKKFDAILLDIDLGAGMDGFEFLRQIKAQDDPIPVIMITHDQAISTVVKAIKMGAYDYVGKKPDLSELKMALERALEAFGLRQEHAFFRDEIRRLSGVLLGESDAMQEVKRQIARLAKTDSTVLITGESGTGKELVAREIHHLSLRGDRPFVAINCAAIPGQLFESEIFGHERGAFTGAIARKKGKFEIAHKGTFFLDEIAELDKAMQAKLLRVLEEKKFERVGGTESIQVDVRIITATNKDLEKSMQQGEFRDDLYYRLHITPIHIPPLRECREDIPILTNEFLQRKSKELRKPVREIAHEAIDLLIAHDWPGNVRELQNMIENAILYSDGYILTK
ncbi:MAG: sigma-54-dependent transcriptional regulator, partial [bacterium]